MLNSDIKNENLLVQGDIPLIAKCVDCSIEQVRKVANKTRQKRQTLLQMTISQVLEYRKEQNKQLVEFSKSLNIQVVAQK